MWGPTGITRLFGSEMGTQISWLIPAALVALLGALWLSRREGRTSKLRAATVLWGTTLIVSGLILSLSKGIIHPYYTVALAPAIGALVGIGGTELWRHREHWSSRVFLSAAIAVTTWWAHVLLGPNADIRVVVASDDPRRWYRCSHEPCWSSDTSSAASRSRSLQARC